VLYLNQPACLSRALYMSCVCLARWSLSTYVAHIC